MALRYGESFKRPADFETGQPDMTQPETCIMNTNSPNGSGWVMLRDPDGPPPPDSPMGANRPTGGY